MRPLKLFPLYFVWHYTTALKNMWQIYTNFLWFVYHFFSIPTLLRNLFSPWRRMQEKSRGHVAEDLIINTVLRLVGFVVRFSTSLVGSLFLLLTAISGLLFYVFWIVAPLAVVALFIFGIISLSIR